MFQISRKRLLIRLTKEYSKKTQLQEYRAVPNKLTQLLYTLTLCIFRHSDYTSLC